MKSLISLISGVPVSYFNIHAASSSAPNNAITHSHIDITTNVIAKHALNNLSKR